MEAETNGTLAFLDLTVLRSENHLKVGIFRKPTHTDRYLNFRSHHPLQTKSGMVKTLALRSIRNIRNCPDLENKELDRLHQVLTNSTNAYPPHIVRQNFNKARELPSLPLDPMTGKIIPELHQTDNIVLERKFPLIIPYVSGIGEQLQRFARRFGVETRFRCSGSVGSIFPSPKDAVSPYKKRGCVYTFNATCGHHYVGETKRNLNVRLKEHENKPAALNDHKRAHSDSRSCTEATIEWPSARVLHQDSHYSRRLIAESLFIKSNLVDTINRDMTSLPLNDCWDCLIHEFKL